MKNAEFNKNFHQKIRLNLKEENSKVSCVWCCNLVIPEVHLNYLGSFEM